MNYQTFLKISFVSLFFYLLFSNSITAQNEIKIRRSTLKVKREGFLEAYQNVLDGDTCAKKGKGAIP